MLCRILCLENSCIISKLRVYKDTQKINHTLLSNGSNPFLSERDFVMIFLNILIQHLDLNNSFKYFIHFSTLLKLGVEKRRQPLYLGCGMNCLLPEVSYIQPYSQQNMGIKFRN